MSSGQFVDSPRHIWTTRTSCPNFLCASRSTTAVLTILLTQQSCSAMRKESWDTKFSLSKCGEGNRRIGRKTSGSRVKSEKGQRPSLFGIYPDGPTLCMFMESFRQEHFDGWGGK